MPTLLSKLQLLAKRARNGGEGSSSGVRNGITGEKASTQWNHPDQSCISTTGDSAHYPSSSFATTADTSSRKGPISLPSVHSSSGNAQDHASGEVLPPALASRYRATAELDYIRQAYYKRLDESGQVYLDYTGASLYPSHLIDWHHNLLSRGIFGNPHSESPASLSTTSHEQAARRAVLSFLDADPDIYDVIFTPNASGGLKIVTENYPFEGKRLVVAMDAHNSVNGMACVARKSGGKVDMIELEDEYSTLDAKMVEDLLISDDTAPNPGLVFFTGQSNITGAKASPKWLEYARQNGWHVGVDASALAPTTSISLTQHPVDFLVISIYKIIGYPTGVGALVVRKDVRRSVLVRNTFSGGTIDAVRPEDGSFRLYDSHAAFEDGTINFLSLPAVTKGLTFIKPLLPVISQRCHILIEYLWEALQSINFDDKYATPLIEIRGPPPGPGRGATLSLLFRQPSNDHTVRLAPFKFIVWAAARQNISVRGGPCLCNPGAASSVLRGVGFEDWEKTVLSESGIIRISLGIASNFADVAAFVRFCKRLANMDFYFAEYRAWSAWQVAAGKRSGQQINFGPP